MLFPRPLNATGVPMPIEQFQWADAENLTRRISDVFSDFPVPTEAHAELEKDRFDDEGNPDEEFALVRKLLNVRRWQDLLQVTLPEDGMMLPCLSPPVSFLAFLPLFMVVTLRDVVLGDGDRMFLDSFVRRLVGDATIGCETVCKCLNDAQSTTLAAYLQFISTKCYRGKDTFEIGGIAELVQLLENG